LKRESKTAKLFFPLDASLQIDRVVALYSICDSNSTEQFFPEVLVKELNL